MENQANNGDNRELEDEEFPDDFQCCVCLDIMYEPVVLACGHISCSGCVMQAMDAFQESHCPVCRHPYNHFPRICEMLHLLLLKLYPSAYKRKGRQIAEEEAEEYGYASPQLDNDLVSSQVSQVLGSDATCGGDNSLVQDSSKGTSPNEDKPSTIPITSTPLLSMSNEVNLQCGVCKHLLCRPAVLNCGHVYCEACIGLHETVCECPMCGSAHPNGVPNVCLVFDHFLEERFPEEYSARKLSLPNFSSASPSGNSPEKQEQAAKRSSLPTNAYSPCFSSHQANNVHPIVGCDYCGIYPIIGIRYKCKDCVEKMGFDLCEGCYNSSSKLPGRFNQRHTQEHQFLKVQPPDFSNMILTLGDEEGSDDYYTNAANIDSTEIVPTLSNLSDDASDNDDELEII